jgi:hypothetical protein
MGKRRKETTNFLFVKLTINLHLLMRSRMCGAIPPLLSIRSVKKIYIYISLPCITMFSTAGYMSLVLNEKIAEYL